MKSGTPATTRNARIAGIVACVPRRAVGNDEFEARFGDKVADVVKMTGVQSRRWVDANTTTADLCHDAAERLLSQTGTERIEVDAVIFVSQTPDYRLPATACLLQDRLGLRAGIIALDVALGCSGYVYGLWLAMMMVQGGAARKVLLAVGDTSSIMNDPDDRSTALLFGDAGTATLVEYTDAAAEAHFVFGTDGSGAEALIVPKGAFRRPAEASRFADAPPDILFMDGGEVFNFTLKAVPQLIADTMASAGRPTDQHDLFLLHQANAFMIKHLAKKAKLPMDKVPINIDRFGNTSSATLPLVMADLSAGQLTSSTSRVAMFGFGVGFSWGGASLDIGPLACAELIER